MESLETLASHFHHAFRHRKWPDDPAAGISELTIEEAYEVQDRVTTMRLDDGERVAGYKVGCTSSAIRSQLNLSEPIAARLFHPHVLEEGVQVDWTEYANCAIEPEMIIAIGNDLHGDDLPDEELIDAIAHVSPGIELHHFTFWHSPRSVQELICSGGIHAGLIAGKARVSPADLPFRDEAFSVCLDGEPVASAPAREIMGGPLHSLRWLVNFLTARGETLEKGSLVIPGSPVELVTIDRDARVQIKIDKVGAVAARFGR